LRVLLFGGQFAEMLPAFFVFAHVGLLIRNQQ
jgi:hypothetical protein